ncbi:uncharacterized protein [Triticum aestivum]|uniref:uncharacterized protein n=1 Tax=Triticum aestivum TaxID=4565 RepID=UPI001D030378|nr:uncharacterized protein LOC123090492 [Triticum aestivum]
MAGRGARAFLSSPSTRARGGQASGSGRARTRPARANARPGGSQRCGARQGAAAGAAEPEQGRCVLVSRGRGRRAQAAGRRGKAGPASTVRGGLLVLQDTAARGHNNRRSCVERGDRPQLLIAPACFLASQPVRVLAS